MTLNDLSATFSVGIYGNFPLFKSISSSLIASVLS